MDLDARSGKLRSKLARPFMQLLLRLYKEYPRTWAQSLPEILWHLHQTPHLMAHVHLTHLHPPSPPSYLTLLQVWEPALGTSQAWPSPSLPPMHVNISLAICVLTCEPQIVCKWIQPPIIISMPNQLPCIIMILPYSLLMCWPGTSSRTSLQLD